MDDQLQSHASMHLLSRVNRLDSIMRYVEGTHCGTCASVGTGDRQCMPLEVAAREARSKGSLSDRVASLEDRLIQLCLDTESRKCTSRPSTVQASYGASSSHELEGAPMCSYPVFNLPNRECNRQSQVHINKNEFQEKFQRVQQRLKHQPGNKDEFTCKNGKKRRRLPSWPHLKLLGC